MSRLTLGTRVGGRPPDDTVAALQAIDMSWLATACAAMGSLALPVQDGAALVWSSTPEFDQPALQPEDLIPTTTINLGRQQGQCCAFGLRAVTLNAQGLGGKHALIEAQLQHKQVHVVFIQEAKDKCGVCHTQHFLRLNTEAERHFGISIWINKALGVFTAEGKAIRVTEADIRIVYEAPRLLVVEIDVGGLRIVLFGGHCPHSGHRSEATMFLQTFYKILRPLRQVHLIVGGLDLNGRPEPGLPGTLESSSMGRLTKQGEKLRRYCRSSAVGSRLHLPDITLVNPGPTATRLERNTALTLLCWAAKPAPTRCSAKSFMMLISAPSGTTISQSAVHSAA